MAKEETLSPIIDMVNGLELRYTDSEITPWAGVVPLLLLLEKLGLRKALENCGSIPRPGSNRGFSPVQMIYGFIVGVWCGATRYAQLDQVRYDSCLTRIIGWERSPGHRAYMRFFNRFTQATNNDVFRDLFTWFFNAIGHKEGGVTMDCDSTVEQRYGSQEGSVKGYNPKRPGRPSHHSILCFLSEPRLVVNYWLRPGDVNTTNNIESFLESTFERLGDMRINLFRADSGFFTGKVIDWLDKRGIPFIIACRFNNNIRCRLAGQKKWTKVTEGIEIAESTYQAASWAGPRRIVMVRQEINKRPNARGKKLKVKEEYKELDLFPEGAIDTMDVSKYRYSCFVTSLDLPMKKVYDLYRGRADCENRIKELKYDFGLDKFAMNNFWANDASSNFIVLAYNLYSFFRAIVDKKGRYPFLKTMRYEMLSMPGYIKKVKVQPKKEPKDGEEPKGGDGQKKGDGYKYKYVLYLARNQNGRKEFTRICREVRKVHFPGPPG